MKDIIEGYMKELVTKYSLTTREESDIRSKFLALYEEAYLEGRDSLEDRFAAYGKKEDWF